jgi:glycosyltransferase involved in cell wall biosynthesis
LSKKILIVANYYPPNVIGGAEIIAHRQARQLREKGYSVSAFTRDRRVAEHGDNVDVVDGISVTRFRPTKSLPENNFIIPEASDQFEALLKSLQPDFVHFHNLVELGTDLVKLAKAKGFRTLLTLHDPWGFCMRHTLIRDHGGICQYFDQCAACQWDIATFNGDRLPIRMRSDFIRWCLSNVDLMISPSSWLKANYEKAGYDQSYIAKLSNGINLNALEPMLRTSRSRVHFLYSGTLAEHKGIDYLLDAAAKLLTIPELRGRWQLSFVGDGPKKTAIIDRIRDLQSVAVSYMGYVDHAELLKSLSDYDVIILPSIWPENQSTVLLEAMASGAAQIATALGGNAELVEHGESGFLVMSRDSSAIAEAMRRIIEDADLLRRFSARNLARRSDFDETNTIDQLIRLYENLETRKVSAGGLIICAGGEPPHEIAWLLNTYSSSTQARSNATFIWEDWATEHEWQNACAVWNWGNVMDPKITAGVRKYMLPLLIPNDACLDRNIITDANVMTYRDATEAMSHIDSLVTAQGSVRHLRQPIATRLS